ncbi:MAG: isochorismatase family protein [Rhizobacter sp.]|nr:isochorismatase family protein [Ferruginibacter sp.]
MKISYFKNTFPVVLMFIFVSCDENKTSENASTQDTTVASNKYTEKLSKSNSVLVMVDYLTGFDPGLKTIEKNLYYHNVTALAQIGQIFKLPTAVLGDTGSFRGNFYPLIDKYLPDAPKLSRHAPSAWTEKSFQDFLQKTGRKKIIIAGISLDNCTLLSSLDLLKNGYEVYVVVDASGTDEKLVEQAAMMRLTQAGAVMVSWVTIASEIMGDWETPEGALVGKLYKDHSAWNGQLGPIER